MGLRMDQVIRGVIRLHLGESLCIPMSCLWVVQVGGCGVSCLLSPECRPSHATFTNKRIEGAERLTYRYGSMLTWSDSNTIGPRKILDDSHSSSECAAWQAWLPRYTLTRTTSQSKIKKYCSRSLTHICVPLDTRSTELEGITKIGWRTIIFFLSEKLRLL